MNDRLTKYIEDNNLFTFNQIGFRKGHRTADHVFVLKTLIDKYLNSGKKLYICFVDFKKAYDTIWRDGLYYKLLKMGINSKFVKLLINLYSGIKSCVNLGEGTTKTFESNVGLKQGCNMSPNLFNLFINDIVECFDKIDSKPAKLLKESLNCLLYADDLVIISETSEGLQNCLNSLNKYTKMWKLSVNYKKTKAMVISKRKTKTKSILKIQNEIDYCEEYNYLGTTISYNGSFKQNSILLHKKALTAMFSILKCINKYHAGNIKILLELLDKMVIPIALYNGEVWGSMLLPKNERSKLINEDSINNIVEKLQNRFLKYILGVNIKATNLVVRSETGRIPLTLKVRYYQHIYNSKSKFVEESLIINKESDEKGTKSWYTGLRRILQNTELDINLIINTNDGNKKNIKNKISNIYNMFWNDERKQHILKGKHQMYAEIKTKNEFENYLEIENMNIRKAITKMRTSSDKFPIETGRYENKERSDRICPLCCNGIGDEQHYIFDCDNKDIKTKRK